MPRKPQPWFRWYVEAFGDRKLRRLTPAQRWLFVAMCGAGKESPELGRLLVAPGLPMTDAEVAEYADVPLRDVLKALPVMDALGMVRRDAAGALVVLNLAHRQYASDTSAERMRAHRERHGDSNSDDVVTSQRRHTGRHSDGGSDAPETETETEAENPPASRGPQPSKPKPKTGTSIDPAFVPPEVDRDAMRRDFPQLTPGDWRTLHAEFIDYWRGVPGARGRKLDWPATWRNHVRRNAPRLLPRNGQRTTATLFGSQQTVTDADREWAAEQDRLALLDPTGA